MTGETQGGATSRRYQALRELGRGGMGCVFEARDLASGALVALKRLRLPTDPARHRHARALFEREFLSLSQLAHPRVVQVFDYGVDAEGPFYTMELLDGGDLQRLAPVQWRAACALIRDVSSVLSLLHSRQMLHRDLTPRNVRCTQEGLAKLFDFGAMSPMGWARDVVGTPPVCAPEVLYQQHLDARADLFSLGCTLYYALVGSHAFPARDFGQLPLLWAQPPAAPSRTAHDVPPELDDLVIGLLQTDPTARPGSAAEVMARLNAIAELPADEQLPVPRAYLSSPKLVGRDGALGRARRKIEQLAEHGRGSAVLLLGRPGTGRSRMLDAVLLEARSRGATVVRAQGADAHGNELGLAPGLARRLLQTQPELARSTATPEDVAVLSILLPELAAVPRETGQFVEPLALDEPHASASRGHSSTPQQQLASNASEPRGEAPKTLAETDSSTRSALMQTLRAWFRTIARRTPLVLGIDDLDAAGSFSESLVALLAHDAAAHPLMVVATADESTFEQASSSERGVLASASTRLTLGPLEPEESESLLRSIFGDTHHLRGLAHRLGPIAQGVPRDLMQLLEHLVHGGVIRYEAGAWSIPRDVDPSDLPASIAEALERRVASLSGDSRALARGLALAPELRVEPHQLLRLTEHDEVPRLVKSLDELLLTGVLRSVDNAFELSQPAWATALLAGASASQRRAALLRVAWLFLELGDSFRAARSLLAAGELERGLEALIDFSRASLAETGDDPEAYVRLLRSLPTDWADTFERGFELCVRMQRGEAALGVLYERGAGIAAGRGGEPGAVKGWLAQLERAVGLDVYPTLAEPADPSARMRRAMALAEIRRQRQPERERLPAPEQALTALTNAYLEALACMVSRVDPGLMHDLPSLEPLREVSPEVAVAMRLGEGVVCRLTGRSHRTRSIYEALLRRAAEPDRAGLDRPHHENAVNQVRIGLGLMEGSLGSVRALAIAQELAENPVNEANALSIRMLFHLWQGDSRQADLCRSRAELLHIEGGDSALFVRRNLAAELPAFAAMDDLAQLRQSMPLVSRMAAEVESWRAIERYAQGEYERIRGAFPQALDALRDACGLVRAGAHPLYCEIHAAYVDALLGAGRVEEALHHAQRGVEEGEAADLDHTLHLLELRVALALAHLGDFAAARALADRAADGLTGVRAGKLLCGLAAETSARIAILEGDPATFEDHIAECGELYKAHGNRALHAKYARLKEEAARRGLWGDARPSLEPVTDAAAMSTVLSARSAPHDLAERALDTMCSQARATGASLFMLERGQPWLVAEVGAMPDALAVQHWAAARLGSTAGDEGAYPDPETRPDGLAAAATSPETRLHHLVIAHWDEGQTWVTGVAVFSLPRERPFRAPSESAAMLSRHWRETGEADALPRRH